MPVHTVPPNRLKAVVTVTAMARAVDLSRSRFYDYVRRGVFPRPAYSTTTRRPYYTVEAQQEILAVRETGIASNGEYVIFYERRPAEAGTAPKRPSRPDPHADLVEKLRSLGLANVTSEQVAQAIAISFPSGTESVDETVVCRTVYRCLRQAKSA